jgi:uncharacterized protein YndB with AHSA1/START domain
MATVLIDRELPVPPAQLYAYLSEHENLGELFGARVERVRDGDTSRNGVGSARRLKVGPLPWFEETTTEAVPDELIVYRITKGSPLRGHVGRMEISPAPGGSRLRYEIRFGAVVPGLDRVVALGLDRTVRQALERYAAKARVAGS